MIPISSTLTGEPEVIGATVLSAAAASVRFDFQPMYRMVQIEAHIIRDANAATTQMRLNNDSGANYAYQYINATGATVAGARATAQTLISLDPVDTVDASVRHHLSILVAKTTPAAKGQVVVISDYDPAASIKLELDAAEWSDTTNALSRIDLISSANNFASGTSISVWGWRE